MQNSPTEQLPGVYRHRVGDVVVTAFLDGTLQGAFSYLHGVPEEQMAREMEAAFRPGQPVISITCFLIQTAGRTILVDSGAGRDDMFDGGRLNAGLQAAGISADEIDMVFVTHLHTDHTGGLVDAQGNAVFTKAELLLHPGERRFWLEGAAPDGMERFFAAAKAATAPYAGAMRTVSTGEIAPGVSVVHLPGHTPGHCGLRISSGTHGMLLWTDIVHLPLLQTRHPELSIAFDVDPDQARAQRRRIFDEVAADRILVAGTHMDFPTFAHLARHGSGYELVPQRWLPQV